MRRLLFLTSLAVFGLAGAAQAEDWTGPYLGVQGGYGWGSSDGNLRVSGFAIPYDLRPSGIIGGVHLGYDFQWGNIVLGFIGDANGADIVGSDTTTHANFTTRLVNNFDASIRSKLGFAYDRFMVYGTGGLAFGNVRTEYSCPTCFMAPGPFDTLSNMRVGWTAGAGVQMAIDRRWSAGLEYRYTDLGSRSFADSVTTASDSGNHFAFNQVQLAVSYHFLPRRIAPPPEPIVPVTAPVPLPMPPPTPAHAYIVFFDFDRYDLTPEGREVVEAAAASFKSHGFARIELNGYTDLAGTQQYNLKLSERRAKTVAEYLAHLGVPRGAMNVLWHGKENPRVPTPDGVREPQNRRVEIVAP